MMMMIFDNICGAATSQDRFLQIFRICAMITVKAPILVKNLKNLLIFLLRVRGGAVFLQISGICQII